MEKKNRKIIKTNIGSLKKTIKCLTISKTDQERKKEQQSQTTQTNDIRNKMVFTTDSTDFNRINIKSYELLKAKKFTT